MKRLHSTLALLLCLTSACATSTAMAPGALLPVAGLPEDSQAELPTKDGDRKAVSGSTEVWLTASNGVTYDVPLSAMKKDGTLLLLPPDNYRFETQGAPDAIIRGRSVGRMVALCGGITGGVLLTVLLIAFAASPKTFFK